MGLKKSEYFNVWNLIVYKSSFFIINSLYFSYFFESNFTTFYFLF